MLSRAARVNADPETFAAWMNAVAQLKKSRFVLGVRRFSDPPAFDDLDSLSLDDTDLTGPADTSVDRDHEALKRQVPLRGVRRLFGLYGLTAVEVQVHPGAHVRGIDLQLVDLTV